MRVTRDRLLELALKETERRAEREGVLSGYVIGSLAAGDPLLGGTGDIDLVLIHETDPLFERELVPLSSEIHLDIAHRSRRFYQEPRKLRRHPWHGPEMCEPAFLYDPTHFFEWAQAAVRGQYHRPDFVYARAQAFLRRARQHLAPTGSGPGWLHGYLRSLLESINAVASLSGFPAAGRQVGLQLADKLGQVGHAGLLERFQLGLGADRLPARALPEAISGWARAYDQALAVRAAEQVESDGGSMGPASGAAGQTQTRPSGAGRQSYYGGPGLALAPERRDYFLLGFQEMVEDGRGSLILWPLLASWEEVAAFADGQAPDWQALLEQLRLSSDFATERSADLEQLQDQIEGQLERWSERVGA